MTKKFAVKRWEEILSRNERVSFTQAMTMCEAQAELIDEALQNAQDQTAEGWTDDSIALAIKELAKLRSLWTINFAALTQAEEDDIRYHVPKKD